MDDDARVAVAEQALVEGDVDAARRIVEVVLARDPTHAGALALRAAIDARHVPPHVPAEAYGDLRPDARHLEEPVDDVDADARPPTPLGVAVLAGLNVVSGGIGAFLGFAVLVSGHGLGLAILALGLVQLAVGVGLWRVRGWAWTIAVIVLALGVVLNLVAAGGGDRMALLLAILQLAVLAYLVAVSRLFLGRAGAPSPATRGRRA